MRLSVDKFCNCVTTLARLTSVSGRQWLSDPLQIFSLNTHATAVFRENPAVSSSLQRAKFRCTNRLVSLAGHALEMTRATRFWKYSFHWLGCDVGRTGRTGLAVV